MKNNYLLKNDDSIIRILDQQDDNVLIINCIKRTMPVWINKTDIKSFHPCKEEELLNETNFEINDMNSLSSTEQRIIHERFSLIASVLPFISQPKKRSEIISNISEERKISKQTIRYYLCLYLVYEEMAALAPKKVEQEKSLSKDEKNMRWALNKFYYTKEKHSLQTTYTMMLKNKYCDEDGNLLLKYPTFNQFRYFYRKTKKLQTYYISRNGLRDYQRNNRPLTGENVQEFAPNVGIGMLDATICDIYLVNDSGKLIGRPILTVCIDAYSSLCCGYALTLEGGVYSLRNLMLNTISDKVALCKEFGIQIKKNKWNSNQIPGVLVTDRGTEYQSETFEQLSELGITVVNLPPYRPELKGTVEKFFDIIQNYYKKHLKGKGIINPDFMTRGSHDYRRDACLTMKEFEKIILQCIIYYNTKRVLKHFPYTEKMIDKNILPYANAIFEYGKGQIGSNLISVTKQQMLYSLLPRTTGKFTRYGLKVNQIRYHCEGFSEEYLKGEEVTVAYNPDDTSYVWLINNGEYIPFKIIENRFKDKTFSEIEMLKAQEKELKNMELKNNYQAKIDLANSIELISNNTSINSDVGLKDITENRKREEEKMHINFMEEI